MTLAWPRRMKNRELARARFGELPDRLVPYLERADPLADAAVTALAGLPPAAREAAIEAALDGAANVLPELLALVEGARQVPPWLDEARLRTAHEVFLRAGLLGGLSLGLCSLVHGYAAPAGNKPLAFSGRLTERADRRLAETSRFVTAVTELDGLRLGALGWRSVLRVRLMHAKCGACCSRAGVGASKSGRTRSISRTCWRRSCSFLRVHRRHPQAGRSRDGRRSRRLPAPVSATSAS